MNCNIHMFLVLLFTAVVLAAASLVHAENLVEPRAVEDDVYIGTGGGGILTSMALIKSKVSILAQKMPQLHQPLSGTISMSILVPSWVIATQVEEASMVIALKLEEGLSPSSARSQSTAIYHSLEK